MKTFQEFLNEGSLQKSASGPYYTTKFKSYIDTRSTGNIDITANTLMGLRDELRSRKLLPKTIMDVQKLFFKMRDDDTFNEASYKARMDDLIVQTLVKLGSEFEKMEAKFLSDIDKLVSRHEKILNQQIKSDILGA